MRDKMADKGRTNIIIRLLVIFLLLGTALFYGCEKPEQTVDQQQIPEAVRATLFPEETRPNLEKFAYDGWKSIGKTIDEIVINFGEPLAVNETPVKNTHYPEYEDIVVDMTFKGLTVQAYRVNKNIDADREIIMRIEITGVWSEPDTGLSIGMGRDDVQRVLGEPDGSEIGMDLYSVNAEYLPPDVYFTYENDKVTGIKWQYYID